MDSSNITVLQNIKGVSKWRKTSITTNPNILFNFKIYHIDIKITFAIFNFNISICYFIIVKNVLWEMDRHFNLPFSKAAPCAKAYPFHLLVILFELNWVFMDHQ